MKKQEFLADLEDKLSKFPRKDVAERINFYEEMIDDRIEDGLSEEEAVADIGTVDDIYAQFLHELPLLNIIKDKIKPDQRMSSRKIALIAATSIVWLPLLIAALSVILSLCAVIWSLVIAVWAVQLALAVCAPAGVITGILSFLEGNITHGVLLLGAGILCAGIAIFAYFGSIYLTKGSIALTKKMIIGIKNLLLK